ncbi:beta-lactamase/transpeptidase-like protein [Mycena capillaripes]|nr:beta-lactamase/transpeptidase-like protein [Mycena capillaripes]
MSIPSLSPAQKDTFDRILSEAVTSKSTAALFFGVTTADGPIYMRTVGNKLVDDPTSDPVDEDTVFWLCSQTKLITSIAALQLIEQGKIALDTPIETVLPELANPVVVTAHDAAGRPVTTVPAKGKITFGQLLNHSSGLDYFVDGTMPPDILPLAYKHRYEDGDVSTFFNFLKGSLPGVPLRFEPGTNFAYGFSSDCAGFIVEKLSGKSLEQYFQDHIFVPLGITSISFYLTPALKNRLLPLSYRKNSGLIERWKGPSKMDPNAANVRMHFGGVGLYGSQKDYLMVLRHLLQIKGAPFWPARATAPILSRTSVDSIFAPTLPIAAVSAARDFVGLIHPHLPIPASAAQFGRGLFVNTMDVPERRRSGSGAWSGYATTSYFVDPAAGVAVVFGTQILPATDDTHERMYALLEKELYAGLRV